MCVGVLDDIYFETRNKESLDHDLLKERLRKRFGLTAEHTKNEFGELCGVESKCCPVI